MRSFAVGHGRTRLRFNFCRWGADVYVHIGAGSEHVGAVALVGEGPGAELHSQVVRVAPHREDQLVLEAAQTLHGATGVTVCVTAGIHLDQITPAELEAVLANAKAGTRRLVKRLGAAGPRASVKQETR